MTYELFKYNTKLSQKVYFSQKCHIKHKLLCVFKGGDLSGFCLREYSLTADLYINFVNMFFQGDK